MKAKQSLRFRFNKSQCEIRDLVPEDVSEKYLQGLKHDSQFIQNVPDDLDIAQQKKYVSRVISSDSDLILGLFVEGLLIGTAGAQRFVICAGRRKEQTGVGFHLGIFIFDMTYRGQGFGKALVWGSTHLLRELFGAVESRAGMVEENVASLRSFLSCGYSQILREKGGIRVRILMEHLKVLPNISEISIVASPPR